MFEMTPAGLEPAIPGSVGRCLIHWATGPDVKSQPLGFYVHFNGTTMTWNSSPPARLNFFMLSD